MRAGCRRGVCRALAEAGAARASDAFSPSRRAHPVGARSRAAAGPRRTASGSCCGRARRGRAHMPAPSAGLRAARACRASRALPRRAPARAPGVPAAHPHGPSSMPRCGRRPRGRTQGSGADARSRSGHAGRSPARRPRRDRSRARGSSPAHAGVRPALPALRRRWGWALGSSASAIMSPPRRNRVRGFWFRRPRFRRFLGA